MQLEGGGGGGRGRERGASVSANVACLDVFFPSLPGSFDCISQDPSLASWNSNPKGLASCYTGSHLGKYQPLVGYFVTFVGGAHILV